MQERSGSLLGLMFIGALLLLDCQPAQATAIALSNITATNLLIASASGVTVFDDFTTLVFAQAQNSLGELDAQFDGTPSNPASANAVVTWADGHSSATGARWFASSNVNLPGDDAKSASSQGQALWFDTFTITGGTGSMPLNFSVDLSGQLKLATDSAGQLAQTEVVFNLLLNGDTILFEDRLRKIGPNSMLIEPFADTLNTSRSLLFDTPYSLVLRVDSESTAINEPVPEPSTAALLSLGLVVAFGFGRLWRGRSQGAAAHHSDMRTTARSATSW